MRRELEQVTTWPLDASAEVPPLYFRLPVAGQEGPAYRERVYCYELYHRWRCLWRTNGYALCGEIDKQGHPIVRRSPKPDFLVHAPGQMANLLVVEVKPRNASFPKMVKDLRTLTYFRRELRDEAYAASYFWLYGVTRAEWPAIAAELTERVAQDDAVDLSMIRPVLHEQAGTRAAFAEWPARNAREG